MPKIGEVRKGLEPINTSQRRKKGGPDSGPNIQVMLGKREHDRQSKLERIKKLSKKTKAKT